MTKKLLKFFDFTWTCGIMEYKGMERVKVFGKGI